MGDLLEILLAQTTAGHGRGTDTDTARGKRGLVTGDRVLVAGDVDLLEDGLDASTIQALGSEVQQDHVAVSAVGNELVADGLEFGLESLCVFDDLLLVLPELGAVGLFEGDRKSGDGVVVRATLVTGEDGEVDGAFKVIHDVLAGLGVGVADTLAEEDHGTTGATERLVGGGGHDIGVLERRRDHTGSNQSGDVSHIDDKVSTDLVGDLAHTRIVNQTAVCRGTSNQALGTVKLGIGLEGIVVNDTGLQVDTVGEGLEVGGNSGDPKPVNEMNRAEPLTSKLTSWRRSGIRDSDGHHGEGQDP